MPGGCQPASPCGARGNSTEARPPFVCQWTVPKPKGRGAKKTGLGKPCLFAGVARIASSPPLLPLTLQLRLADAMPSHLVAARSRGGPWPQRTACTVQPRAGARLVQWLNQYYVVRASCRSRLHASYSRILALIAQSSVLATRPACPGIAPFMSSSLELHWRCVMKSGLKKVVEKGFWDS